MRRLILCVAAACSASLHAADGAVATCFNDSHASGKLLGVWTYYGHRDWRSAWAATRKDSIPATFVFGFVPGRKEYAVSELAYCFHLPAGKPGPRVRCREGKLVLSELNVPAALAGTYDFTLANGERRQLRFRAPYCPKQ